MKNVRVVLLCVRLLRGKRLENLRGSIRIKGRRRQQQWHAPKRKIDSGQTSDFKQTYINRESEVDGKIENLEVRYKGSIYICR